MLSANAWSSEGDLRVKFLCIWIEGSREKGGWVDSDMVVGDKGERPRVGCGPQWLHWEPPRPWLCSAFRARSDTKPEESNED